MNREQINYKFEYHEGYYAAGNNIPYDPEQTDAWKEGWLDGMASLNGDDELYGGW